MHIPSFDVFFVKRRLQAAWDLLPKNRKGWMTCFIRFKRSGCFGLSLITTKPLASCPCTECQETTNKDGQQDSSSNLGWKVSLVVEAAVLGEHAWTSEKCQRLRYKVLFRKRLSVAKTHVLPVSCWKSSQWMSNIMLFGRVLLAKLLDANFLKASEQFLMIFDWDFAIIDGNEKNATNKWGFNS